MLPLRSISSRNLWSPDCMLGIVAGPMSPQSEKDLSCTRVIGGHVMHRNTTDINSLLCTSRIRTSAAPCDLTQACRTFEYM